MAAMYSFWQYEYDYQRHYTQVELNAIAHAEHLESIRKRKQGSRY